MKSTGLKISHAMLTFEQKKRMDATIALSEYELERGKPMPSKNHAIVQSNLLFSIRQHFGSLYQVLPEINLDLPIRERIPDLAIYTNVDFTPGADELRMKEPPLGVIEIISSQQSITELMEKRGEYFNAGVQSYWLVLPDLMSVYVFYSLDDFEVSVKKDILIDKKLHIQLDLSEIFI